LKASLLTALHYNLTFNFGIENYLTMGILRQFAEYLYLKKKDPNAPKTQYVKYMHGMNRISLLLAIAAIIILIIKLLR
jgi:hypothetical protein